LEAVLAAATAAVTTGVENDTDVNPDAPADKLAVVDTAVPGLRVALNAKAKANGAHPTRRWKLGTVAAKAQG
jgi:hypothetical protein